MKATEQHKKHTGFSFLWLFILALYSSNVLSAETKVSKQQTTESEKISLGFFPIISTVALYKRFGPLAKYLSEELGKPVQLKTAKNFPTFVKRTSQRAYDIVITAPHFAIKANDSKKYQIKATLVSNVQQLVVVHKDSPIESIDELAGLEVATPPVKALMTKMGKDMFKKAGMTGEQSPVYTAFTSHNAANKSVTDGKIKAAIASSNIVKKAVKKGAPLKVIGKGLLFPNMATMIASDVDTKTASSVVNAFLNMKNSEKGRSVLKDIGFPGYRKVDASEYEVVRPYL